jgi:hypothetical protein
MKYVKLEVGQKDEARDESYGKAGTGEKSPHVQLLSLRGKQAGTSDSSELHLMLTCTVDDIDSVNMAEDAPRRSRFDQTEPARPSRFDRRSRSPASRQQSDSRRSRSPAGRDGVSPASSSTLKSPKGPIKDPAKAAAEAAAKINAMLQVRIIAPSRMPFR